MCDPLSPTERALKCYLATVTNFDQIVQLCQEVGGRGRVFSQQTLDGKIASARSAKHPAVELYDRLGLEHSTRRDMRASFPQSSVYDLDERHRRRLIRVSTPLVKVGEPNPKP